MHSAPFLFSNCLYYPPDQRDPCSGSIIRPLSLCISLPPRPQSAAQDKGCIPGIAHNPLIQCPTICHSVLQDKGCIPGIDFARSLVASASLNSVFGLLDKVWSLLGRRLLGAGLAGGHRG